MTRILLALTVLLALVGSAHGASASRPGFAARVTNPWFPLKAGSVYTYRGEKDGEPSREVLTVTHRTATIGGYPAAVVDDRLWIRGRLEERTTDWYSQDRAGNVWYVGEQTAELRRDGSVRSTEGTWQAGRDGARAGIFMPAHPKVGSSARQESYPGHAEDHFRVLALAAHVHVPWGNSSQALLTKEWTPLEPGVVDHKYYVRGIGTVLEQTVKGGSERNELVSFSNGG
jgi:hypothetical protein